MTENRMVIKNSFDTLINIKKIYSVCWKLLFAWHQELCLQKVKIPTSLSTFWMNFLHVWTVNQQNISKLRKFYAKISIFLIWNHTKILKSLWFIGYKTGIYYKWAKRPMFLLAVIYVVKLLSGDSLRKKYEDFYTKPKLELHSER